MSTPDLLPIPDFFDRHKVGQIWRVPYELRAKQADAWGAQYNLLPSANDHHNICLMLVDVQNTFCLPGFELFVTGAVNDNRRLCKFIYRHLGAITQFIVTMDTHQAMQIFHALFLVDEAGEHPPPYTLISVKDVRTGKWKFNDTLAAYLGVTPAEGQERLLHYVNQLDGKSKYALTTWPYHAMLGGIGHALVPAVEEAIFFHSMARLSQPRFEIKGRRPFTEHYSVIGPEVEKGPHGETLGEHNPRFIETLKQVDALIVAGQAKSHCVAWTMSDLLDDLLKDDPLLAKKIYLLEDCTSPVVVPGGDYTEQADAAFQRFAESGMHLVKSTERISAWPGFPI